MKFITSYLFFIAMFSLASCANGQNSSDKYKKVEVAEYMKMISMDSTVQLVDVRTPEEFEAGHLDGAINIDFKNENFANNISVLDTSKTLYIYCRSGNRSGKSSVTFLEKGFPEIIDLMGGYLEYEKVILKKE